MEQVFHLCVNVLNAIFFNSSEPFAFKNVLLPFKNSNYFTCVNGYIDINLHYVDRFSFVYQESALWENKSRCW